MDSDAAGDFSRSGVTFRRHETKSDDKESVWYYFLCEMPTKQSAKCTVSSCSKIIKTVGGSTKGLHTHLKSVHNINLLAKKTNTSEVACSSTQQKEPARKKTKMTDYFIDKDEKSLAAVLSRMTSLDGLPFSIFCTSADIREGLRARGFSDLPTSPNTARKIVMDYSKKVRQYVVNKMMQEKSNGKKFSLTFDEWTSVANKRYMNINVHSDDGKFWSLGLVRVSGSMPAEKCIQLVEDKLKQHGLSLSRDVVCVTTDGASVMTKVGRLIQCHQQLCFAHGIQLAVLQVLYKKKSQGIDIDAVQRQENVGHTTAVPEQSEFPLAVNVTGDSASDDLLEMELELGVEECECDALSFVEGEATLELEVFPELEVNLNALVQKVRQVVCLFKKSPTKNDVLRKYVREEFGKELSVLLDSKTRWSSLFTMLERFYAIRNPIRKALIDVKSNTVFTEEDFVQIHDVVYSLEAVKLTVESLCRRQATLLTADAALKFMIQKLRSSKSALSADLVNALFIRIRERRTNLSGVLQFLHNPKVNEGKNFEGREDEADLFSVPPVAEVRKIVKSLIEQLHMDDDSESESDRDTTTEASTSATESSACIQNQETLSLKEQLNLAISDSLQSAQQQSGTTLTSDNLAKVIRQEIALFEGGGSRGRHLQLVYDYLLSVPPSSVEAERAFSAAGIVCSRLRTRLGDDTLDNLCFLRSFFVVIVLSK